MTVVSVVFKVVVYAAAGLGLSFLVAVFAGAFIAAGNRRLGQQRYTVRWRDTDVMECAYTGTIRPLGEHHIIVEDERGWPVVVDKRDIIEVLP